MTSGRKRQEHPGGAWFRESKYAMFVHWGLYSQAGGVWHGKRYHGVGEWLMYQAQIPIRDYAALAKRFNPVKFSARQWCRIAKDAGMRYIVVTAKHHDGFAMFKSAASPFNIADATPFGRDPLLELSEECRRQGLRLGFYYSQFQDWHEPGGSGNTWDTAARGDFNVYFKNKALPQVRELSSNYGPVALIWFDTPGTMSRTDSMKLVAAVRELQPNCLINSRIGNGVGDYDSLGDQEVPSEAHEGLWETVDTHNDTWGYVGHDGNWKDARELVDRLVRVVARGGNYMLNVGPNGLGEIPRKSADLLREAGQWVRRNAAAIYGAQASPLGHLPWGECTARPGRLYLSVMDWPRSGRLQLPGFKGCVRRASFLASPGRKLAVSPRRDALTIAVPALPPDFPTPVIVLETAGAVQGSTEITVLAGHRNEFDPYTARLRSCRMEKYSWMEKFGDWKHAACVTDWTGPGSSAAWTFRTIEAGRYYVEISYSCREGSDGTEGALTLGTQKMPFPVLDSGERSTAVPNHRLWPLFRVYRLGLVELPRAAKHTLAIRPSQQVADGWIKLKSVSLVPVPSA